MAQGYVIRSEITYRTGEHAVNYWLGAGGNIWTGHPSKAAGFKTIRGARAAFKATFGAYPESRTGDPHRYSTVGPIDLT